MAKGGREQGTELGLASGMLFKEGSQGERRKRVLRAAGETSPVQNELLNSNVERSRISGRSICLKIAGKGSFEGRRPVKPALLDEFGDAGRGDRL